jgi:hypothetical protein
MHQAGTGKVDRRIMHDESVGFKWTCISWEIRTGKEERFLYRFIDRDYYRIKDCTLVH